MSLGFGGGLLGNLLPGLFGGDKSSGGQGGLGGLFKKKNETELPIDGPTQLPGNRGILGNSVGNIRPGTEKTAPTAGPQQEFRPVGVPPASVGQEPLPEPASAPTAPTAQMAEVPSNNQPLAPPQENPQGLLAGKMKGSTSSGLATFNKNINLEGLQNTDKIGAIMEEMRGLGWDPAIGSGVRTLKQQKEKVRKGYSKTLKSRHLKGQAVDIVDKRYGWGGKASDTNFKFWKDLGKVSKKHGAQWGGDWKSFKDVAHVQF